MRRRSLWWWLWGALALAGGAQAQTAGERGAAYVDRYLTGSDQPADISYGDDAGDTADGLARVLQVEAVDSLLRHEAGARTTRTHETGFVVSSQWDTAAYGAWSLDASARTDGGASGYGLNGATGGHVALSLHQRDMAFDGGWRVNNALGDISSLGIAALRLQSRFYFPATPIQGISSEWLGPASTQIVGSLGTPGVFTGLRAQDFATLGGTTATLGAQWSPVSNLSLGAQAITARDTVAQSTLVDPAMRLSSDSLLLTGAWRVGRLRTQLGLIGGRVRDIGHGSGIWLDGNWSAGRFNHAAGAFRIDPNLSWGSQSIVSDAEGGYYSVGYQSRRWQYNGGIDLLASLSGSGTRTVYVNNAVRYQWSRDVGIGGALTVSQANGSRSWSAQAYRDRRNDWGTSRLQVHAAEDASGRDATLTLDQAWNTRIGLRLSTALDVERLQSRGPGAQSQTVGEPDSTAVALSVYGGGDFWSRWSLEGNVRWARAIQGVNAPAIAANVALGCQVSTRWALQAAFYASRTSAWSSIVVATPLAPPSTQLNAASADTGVFVTLRYRRASGAHFAPLGGSAGSGWGSLVGHVFLDANDSEAMDASESGVANMEIILDGRYRVRTDAQGRYEFPAVAAGRHTLAVLPDNLPLPWMLPADGAIVVDVSTRQATRLDVAARRPNSGN